MSSLIDPTKPTAVLALTSDVRANFAAAKSEIEALQGFEGDGPYLPLDDGGSVSGPINVTVTGTPIARSIQDSLADAVNVKSFGAIMDGASHPLSTKYATLAAAQAVYPHAQALTDEIDWCAIQGAVNAGNVAIRIPAGAALINRPIVSSTVSITVIGEGTEVSSIVQNAAGQDGWQHNSAMRFQMFGLRLTRNGTGGVALNLNFTGGAPARRCETWPSPATAMQPQITGTTGSR